uniref:Uncharacterized protein n=1 Tax=Cacopsylla melanoneura TaxID=428564 RepID=A0A8D8ZCW5_9HEMI
MDKTMVTVAGLAAVGIGAVALYLYYNRSEDEAPGDEPVSVGPSPRPSPYALIPWKSGLFSTPTETLHVAVFLVRSYSTKPSTDIAQRAVYAIWCLKAKYTGDKQLEKWEKGGAVKKLYMNKTSEELDELYKRVQERGFGQVR